MQLQDLRDHQLNGCEWQLIQFPSLEKIHIFVEKLKVKYDQDKKALEKCLEIFELKKVTLQKRFRLIIKEIFLRFHLFKKFYFFGKFYKVPHVISLRPLCFHDTHVSELFYTQPLFCLFVIFLFVFFCVK
jgi:hypothetical protein